MLKPHVRHLTESERRLLRAKCWSLHSRSRGHWAFAGIGVAVFGVLWVVTLFVSESPWHIVTGFWSVVGVGIMFWVRRDLNKDDRAFDAMRERMSSALRANKAKVIDVTATAFVALEEVEDEGACYAFEVADDTLLLLSGQQYYEAARFPSLDFSLVDVLDERNRIVDAWIRKRGSKAAPQRVIPAATKWQLELPDD